MQESCEDAAVIEIHPGTCTSTVSGGASYLIHHVKRVSNAPDLILSGAPHDPVNNKVEK